MRVQSRRTFLAGLAGAAFVACGGASAQAPGPGVRLPNIATDGPPEPGGSATARVSPAAAAIPATPVPTAARAVRGQASEERALMPGTPWETRLSIRHSGLRGPAVLVLGGVHGNEPGGWLAAEQVASWVPATGSLLVVPRANVLAIPDFVRTTEELGDLNRLYPGDPASAFPMERMAAAIVATAVEFQCEVLLDMHESWAFYAEYPGTGTGALGQTITPGVGPRRETIGAEMAAHVNTVVSVREQFIVRDGTTFRRPDATPPPGQTNRGRSSLSVGGYVPSLTPILVEMGQEHQEIDRRVELHLLTARALLELLGVV